MGGVLVEHPGLVHDHPLTPAQPRLARRAGVGAPGARGRCRRRRGVSIRRRGSTATRARTRAPQPGSRARRVLRARPARPASSAQPPATLARARRRPRSRCASIVVFPLPAAPSTITSGSVEATAAAASVCPGSSPALAPARRTSGCSGSCSGTRAVSQVAQLGLGLHHAHARQMRDMLRAWLRRAGGSRSNPRPPAPVASLHELAQLCGRGAHSVLGDDPGDVLLAPCAASTPTHLRRSDRAPAMRPPAR